MAQLADNGYIMEQVSYEDANVSTPQLGAPQFEGNPQAEVVPTDPECDIALDGGDLHTRVGSEQGP